MKLTCVTAVFNAVKSGNRENLFRCVRSVAALKTEHEHLIYDGGSTDGTVELLRELAREVEVESRNRRADGSSPSKSGIDNHHSSTSTLNFNSNSALRVVSEPDTGIYNALNKGVRDAKGEWFYVLGCDDYIINPDNFDSLIAAEESSTELIIAPTVREGEDHLYKKFDDLRILFRQFPYSHQSVIMKTEVVRQVGGFDERYKIAADWKMLMTCYKTNRRFRYYELPITYYAEGGLSERIETAGEETISVYASFWGLRGWRYKLFAATGYVQLHKVLGLFRHGDPAARVAARYAVRLWFVAVMRIVLWPVIVLRRRILFGKSKKIRI